MRILVDGLPLLGNGGITSYVRGLVKALLAFDPANEYELLFRTFPRSRRRDVQRLREHPDLAPARFRCLPIPDGALERAWRLGAWTSWVLPSNSQTDLFLATLLIAPWLGQGRVVPLVYDLIPLRFPQWYGREAAGLERRLRTIAHQARVWIAISEASRNDLQEFLGIRAESIRVVYPGVDAAFQPLPTPVDQEGGPAGYGIKSPYLLYVGGYGPHKNVDTLIRVFRRLKRAHRIPHQLVLCGSTEWGQGVVHAAQDLITTGQCVVLNFIPAAHLPHLYRGADAFAYLSLHEGFGLPPLEAMACGVPVVVSNTGSLPEVVGDAGLLVPPTEEAAIEHALYQVLTAPDLRRDLRARGIRQAATFSWSEAAHQTLDVFAAVRGGA